MCAAEPGIVGDEPRVDQRLLYDRVTPALNDQALAVVDVRSNVVLLCRQLAQSGEHVKRRRGVRQLAQARRIGGDVVAHGGEEVVLQRFDPLLCVEDLRLVLFELRRNEAFAVGDRLLADVALGGEVQVRLGDFDEVAEDLVVLHLQ